MITVVTATPTEPTRPLAQALAILKAKGVMGTDNVKLEDYAMNLEGTWSITLSGEFLVL